MMISNNPYRLDEHRGPCRPRLDEGLLGIVVLPEPPRPVREWTAASFSIEAGSAVAAGIDGEAAMLEAPLQFKARPGALKVRIGRSQPGASPSAIAVRAMSPSQPDGAGWSAPAVPRRRRCTTPDASMTPSTRRSRRLPRRAWTQGMRRAHARGGLLAAVARLRGDPRLDPGLVRTGRSCQRACVRRRLVGCRQPRAQAAHSAPASGLEPPGRGPPDADPDSSSLPSGHSASAFAFATGVGSVLPGEAIPIRALAALVAYSRVRTGVHHPADVVAGALLGTMLGQLTCRAFDHRR